MKEIISDRASLLQKELSLSSKSPVRSRTKAMNHTLKRARGLWKITSLLSNATSIEEVAKIVIDEGFRVMGAHNGDLALLSHDGSLHLIAYKGYPKNFQKKVANLLQ